MNMPGKPTPFAQDNRPKTLTDQAYMMLRADVIAGRLKPGAKLRVEQLRTQYEVGATPLREALSRLSADGFVISEGQRGFRVVPMSVADLQDITNVRILIETEALRNSISSGNEAWEERLVAAYYRLSKLEAGEGNFDARERANEEFHAALLAGCNSPLLLRLHRTLYDQHKRYRNISLLTTVSIPRDVHEEHRAIYEAALARQLDKACDATRLHILRTMDVTLEVFRKAEKEAAS